jgi:MFS family permease
MCVRDLPPAPAERAGEAALRDASRTLSARVCARAASLTRRGSLAHAFRDPRLLLLTPTNVAFGLMTSFFPAKVGGLVKAAEGVASVGWYFALAAASSTLLTLLAMVASQKLRSARAMTILIGAASFGTASASLAVCPTASCAASLTHLQLFLCFICYGAGVAAWQSGCMALVGDMSQSEPHAAFALLKFTSGFASAVGFFVFPTMGARSVARVCLGAVLVGALCVSLLLRRYGANGTSGGSANKDERPLVPVVPLSPRAGDTSTRSSGEKLMQMEPFRS